MKPMSRSVLAILPIAWLLGCSESSSLSSGESGRGDGSFSSGAGGATLSTGTTTPVASGAGGASAPPPVYVASSGGTSGKTSSSTTRGAGGAGMGGAMVIGAGGSSGRGGATAVPGPHDGGLAARDASARGDAGGLGTGGSLAIDGGDKYVPVGTNPFVMTAHDPFSTFAADVDTASYDIFRRDANQGLLPAPASVRLEEYVNYFSYDYPAPNPDAPYPFQISLAAANHVFDRGTALLRVGVQAAFPPPFVKKPTNLVFLLDVSGSMGDVNKLPLVKTLILATLERLDDSDHVALVTYSDTARVVVPSTSMEKRADIEAAVAGLVAGGSTAGADGIGLAYQQAAAGFVAGGINHIVMCTDGDFNVGPSSTSELLSLIRSQRSTGVTLTVLGFGSGNLNDAMMEQIADAGNGIYSVIIDEASAKDYAAEKILSTITHVAKDMKLQVEFNPDKVLAYRLLGYEDRAIADTGFRNDAVDAGEVGAGHRVTALYEMVLTGGTVPMTAGAPVPDDGEPSPLPREVGADDFVLVKVRYKPVDGTDATPAIEIAGSLPTVLLTESFLAADADLQWATAVAALAEILKTSPYADRSFLPTIRAVAAAQAGRDADRAEFATLLERIAPKL
ncbi:MAG: von Willebrand factor type A domain-containing protein [Deltaproteobacteria bacterium]|nr:von Willebrand factor type A domain-containing protein [Deltaproteobacteria bacterium]